MVYVSRRDRKPLGNGERAPHGGWESNIEHNHPPFIFTTTLLQCLQQVCPPSPPPCRPTVSTPSLHIHNIRPTSNRLHQQHKRTSRPRTTTSLTNTLLLMLPTHGTRPLQLVHRRHHTNEAIRYRLPQKAPTRLSSRTTLMRHHTHILHPLQRKKLTHGVSGRKYIVPFTFRWVLLTEPMDRFCPSR